MTDMVDLLSFLAAAVVSLALAGLLVVGGIGVMFRLQDRLDPLTGQRLGTVAVAGFLAAEYIAERDWDGTAWWFAQLGCGIVAFSAIHLLVGRASR